ncbi:MAG TPA: AAA family ATPase [Blastocatellia bacterium]|nr:AAA family ATPase [Blastocatellia bacterium]
MRLPRLAEPILALLNQALTQGHTCLPLNEIICRLQSCHSNAPESEILSALGHLNKRGDIRVRVWQRIGQVSLSHAARAEETIAHGLQQIGRRLRPVKAERVNEWIRLEGEQLTDEQRAAIRLLMTAPIAILTGDPGTGKTATIKVLTAICERAGYHIHLTAPTGRAAARLAEAAGRPAQTLHRLLHNHQPRQRTLRDLIVGRPPEVVIVDEASMLDVFLAERLVRYCSPRTRLIFVGDVHQLPPVGPGQVLQDLIASGCLPVVELTTRFRQSEQSRITAAARDIKAGRVPELPAPGKAKADCYFIEADNVTEIQQLVVNAATRSLPVRCGANPYRDVQILTPMRNGALGTVVLNYLVRRASDKAITSEQSPFAAGDRVLQTRNNYRLGLFNGECGFVEEVADKTTQVRFGNRLVTYQQAFHADLLHGFAITIHRSQGSEYPFVIIPVHESQNVMLTRELLYTALTRGRQMVVLIGSRRAFARAVSLTNSHRLTGLSSLLSPSAPGPGKAA